MRVGSGFMHSVDRSKVRRRSAMGVSSPIQGMSGAAFKVAHAKLSNPYTASVSSLTSNGSVQRGSSAALKALTLAGLVSAADKR